MLVELTPDIHICGICKQQFNNLDTFVAHKQSGCQLTSTSGTAPSTVQFVSEETVPATQTQTTPRTITSETQTITGTSGALGVGGGLAVAQTTPWSLLKYLPRARADPLFLTSSAGKPTAQPGLGVAGSLQS